MDNENIGRDGHLIIVQESNNMDIYLQFQGNNDGMYRISSVS